MTVTDCTSVLASAPLETRPATKGDQRAKAYPGSNLAPELLFILLYLVYFCPPQTLVYPLPLKYFSLTMICFLVAALVETEV